MGFGATPIFWSGCFFSPTFPAFDSLGFHTQVLRDCFVGSTAEHKDFMNASSSLPRMEVSVCQIPAHSDPVCGGDFRMHEEDDPVDGKHVSGANQQGEKEGSRRPDSSRDRC